MSVYDYSLMCNFPKCRGRLSGFAWVTACSHIFCDRHGSGEFSRPPAICPACSSALSGKLDIVRTELAPSEQYKAMVLVGLRPETVLDISHRALAFWTYQVCFTFKVTNPHILVQKKTKKNKQTSIYFSLIPRNPGTAIPAWRQGNSDVHSFIFSSSSILHQTTHIQPDLNTVFKWQTNFQRQARTWYLVQTNRPEQWCGVLWLCNLTWWPV